LPRTTRILLFSLLLLSIAPLQANDWRVDDADRVVAISDIHGAYDAMVETLQNVGILDAGKAWAGGSSRLVIVGDVLDRGPRSRDVMDLLMRIEDEAQAAGGYVHVLIGNHESMNMIGDMRYVSKEEYAASMRICGASRCPATKRRCRKRSTAPFLQVFLPCARPSAPKASTESGCSANRSSPLSMAPGSFTVACPPW
jgi:hypothetical protein